MILWGLLKIHPIPIKRALAWNKETHRRLPLLQGAMWAIAALHEHPITEQSEVVGVAIVGRPNAQVLESRELWQPRLQVLRVACIEGVVSSSGHKGVNSILYAACARAARNMGAVDLWTYIHKGEPGISLKAAGWIEDVEHKSLGGSYDRPSRRRAAPVESGEKIRYFAPWSELLQRGAK